MKARLVSSLALCGWLLGCGMDPETPAPAPAPSPTPGPEPSPSPAPNPKLSPPSIDAATPRETCGKEVGIRGQATPGMAVFAFGGAATSGVATDANPVTGAFCLPLTLVAGKENAIEVRVQDPVLGISEPTTVTVLQKSCTPEELGGTGGTVEEPPKSKNVAIGATGKSKDSPETGNLGFLTDGKSTTVATWKGGSVWCNWCDYDGWVTIKLDRLYEVEKIVVRWRDSKGKGTAFGKEYKVLVSPMSDPGDPNLKNGYWEEMASTSTGDGGTDGYDLSKQKPVVQHVALWLQQDDYPWTKEFVGKEEFAVAEIEVWDAPKQAGPPPPPASVCQ